MFRIDVVEGTGATFCLGRIVYKILEINIRKLKI
jgi:hypothetical protein